MMLVGHVGNVKGINLNLLRVVSHALELTKAQNGFDGHCFFWNSHSLFVINVLEISMIQNTPLGLKGSSRPGIDLQDSRFGLQMAGRRSSVGTSSLVENQLRSC